MTKAKRLIAILVFAVLFLVYQISYLLLSRPLIAKARSENSDVYFFVSPRTDAGFRKHLLLRMVYYPLWKTESALGGDFQPGAYQPLYDLTLFSPPD